MRVVSGKAKGRKLSPVPGDTTRPILDRVKTALFDTLRPHIENWHVLDLFAGSGSVGIEALSQGASFCVFTDLSKVAVETIKENLAHTQLGASAEVRNMDAFTYLRNTSKDFDLIYIAPPQYKGIWIEAMHCVAERPSLIRDNGMVIVQIDPSEYEPLSLTHFHEEEQRKYGNTLLIFYQKFHKDSA